MFFIPDKIADFTDEVAKSRIKIFQLWRKLLAFTFGFIKKITLYNGSVPVWLHDFKWLTRHFTNKLFWVWHLTFCKILMQFFLKTVYLLYHLASSVLCMSDLLLYSLHFVKAIHIICKFHNLYLSTAQNEVVTDVLSFCEVMIMY